MSHKKEGFNGILTKNEISHNVNNEEVRKVDLECVDDGSLFTRTHCIKLHCLTCGLACKLVYLYCKNHGNVAEALIFYVEAERWYQQCVSKLTVFHRSH